MKKKFFTFLTFFTILYSVNVYADTPYVHNQPTKDTTKKIELSVDADDVIIDDKDIEFAWYFEDADGTITPIQTEDSVLDDKDGNYWAKGDENGKSVLVITYENYGNGKYYVIARDTLHNVSEPKIKTINGWDITAPTATGLTIDKSGLMKESTVALEGADDDIVLANKPYILSEIEGWDGVSNSGFTKTNTKPASSGNEFIFTKNGDYCITLTDYAGNETEFPFTVDNVDRAIPVISSIEYSNNNGAINVTVNATDNSSEEPLVNYSHEFRFLIADSPEEIEGADISSWKTTNVLSDKLNGELITTGKASYYVGVIDEAGNYAVTPFSIDADLVLGNLSSMSADELTSYISFSPSKWTNGDVVCRVDIPSGVFADDVEYEFNSLGYQASNKKTFIDNGTVTVKVKDKYDNVYTSNPLVIDYIDKKKPEFVDISLNGSQNRVTISVKDTDERSTDYISGITKVTISGAGYAQETSITDYQDTPVYADTIKYDVRSKGTYVFTVYDLAGNKETYDLDIAGSITDNEDLINGFVKNRMTHVPSGWTNTDVELRVALTSEEALDENPFKWDSEEYSKDKAIIVTENSIHTLTVKDMYGNEYESGDYEVANIDKVKPTISVDFTSEDKNTFKVTCLDELSGLLKVTMTGEDNIEYTIKDYLNTAPTDEQKFTHKVPKNGDYTFTAYDLAGNTETFDITVDNAQITNALLDSDSIVSYVTHNPTEWTNGDVTLRLTLPSLEGLAAEPFLWNTSAYKPTSDVVVTCNGDYFITVKDEYGYEHPSDNYTVSNIDKIAPTVTSSVNANNNVITLDIIDEDSAIYGASGLRVVTVTSLKNPSVITVKDYLTSVTEDTVSYVLSVDDEYTFHIYDRAGNVTDETVVITKGKVDNVELTPEGLLSELSHTPTKWTNKPVTLRVSLISEEGLAAVPYKWGESQEFTNSRIATVDHNGDYKVWVKDTFDNVIESEPYHIGNIDLLKPTISTELDDKENTVTITVGDDLSGISKVTVSDMSGAEYTIKDYYATEPLEDTFEWEVPYKATFTFKVYDNSGNWEYVQKTIVNSITDNEDLSDSGIASYITHTPTEWTNKPVTLQVNLPSFEELNPLAPFKWDDNTYSNSKTYVVNEIGFYTLTIKDKYGNEITSLPHEVANVDHIDPVLECSLNKEKNAATISVKELPDSNGASSGLDKITVITDGAETTIKNYITDTKSDVYEYAIPKNGTYVFKVYDNAGNAVETENIVIKNAITGSEVLTAFGIRSSVIQTPAADDFTNDTVTLSLVLNGETGLADVPYKWNGEEFTTATSYTVSKNGNYSIAVKDKYGNIINSSYEVRNIDKDIPVVTVSLVEDNRLLEINVTDDKLGSSLDKVTIEGGELTGVSVIGDYNDAVFSDTFRIATPSKGVFTITVYDKAGNYASTDITVDDVYTLNSELSVENITASIQSMQTEWTNGIVPLKLVLKNLDNLADAPYCWSNGETETGFSTDNTYNVDANGFYYVTVKDKFGNTFTSEPYEVSNIDHVIPEISYSLNDAQTVMTLNVSDSGSGVNKIAWQGDAFTGLVSIKEYLQPVASDEGIEVAIPTNGHYTVTVYDCGGNTESVDVTVTNIQSQNPILTPLGVYSSIKAYPSTWTNGDVSVSAELLNKENVLPEGYLWDSTCESGTDSIVGEWTSYTSYTATSNGVITLSVKDEFGTPQSVHTSLPYAVENIDKIAPNIWFNELGDGVVNVNASDEASDLYGASGIKEISVVAPNGVMTILKRNGVGLVSDSVNYAMFLQGHYTFRVEDNAGNITEDYLDIPWDNAAVSNSWLSQGSAAIDNALNFTPTEWTKGSVTITLAPEDTTNFATKPYKFGDGDWQSENYAIFNENTAFTVKIRDVNGVEYESGKIEINSIDRTSPQLDIQAVNVTDNMCQITVTGTDLDSGISLITIIGDEMPNETIIQRFEDGFNNASGSYNVKKNGHFKIRVYDMTGNVTEGMVTVEGLKTSTTFNNTPVNNDIPVNNYYEGGSKTVATPVRSVTTTNTSTYTAPSTSTTRSTGSNTAFVNNTATNTQQASENTNMSQKKGVIETIKDALTKPSSDTTSEASKTTETVKSTESSKSSVAKTTAPIKVVNASDGTIKTTAQQVSANENIEEVKEPDVVVMSRNNQLAENEEVATPDTKKGGNIILGLLVGLIAFSAIILGIRYYYKRKNI